jgi:diadenosine tetraphosphate (Ap4A) HIT family hydrolase
MSMKIYSCSFCSNNIERYYHYKNTDCLFCILQNNQQKNPHYFISLKIKHVSFFKTTE